MLKSSRIELFGILFMSQCEKEIDGIICGQDASSGLTDSAGHTHWYCRQHIWEQFSSHGEGTCDMLGADPPSMERCGRPAVMKLTNPAGEVKYFCERCRRKHFPSEAEETADREQDERNEKISAALQPVWSILGAAFWITLVGFAIYLLVAFIKWCWTHS